MSTDRFEENQTYYRVLQGDSATDYLADGAPNQREMVTFVRQENIRSPHTGMQILTYVFEKSDGTTVYDSGEPLEYAYFKFNLPENHMNNISDFLEKRGGKYRKYRKSRKSRKYRKSRKSRKARKYRKKLLRLT